MNWRSIQVYFFVDYKQWIAQVNHNLDVDSDERNYFSKLLKICSIFLETPSVYRWTPSLAALCYSACSSCPASETRCTPLFRVFQSYPFWTQARLRLLQSQLRWWARFSLSVSDLQQNSVVLRFSRLAYGFSWTYPFRTSSCKSYSIVEASFCLK